MLQQVISGSTSRHGTVNASSKIFLYSVPLCTVGCLGGAFVSWGLCLCQGGMFGLIESELLCEDGGNFWGGFKV